MSFFFLFPLWRNKQKLIKKSHSDDV
jgi:hypothetical protein